MEKYKKRYIFFCYQIDCQLKPAELRYRNERTEKRSFIMEGGNGAIQHQI